MNVTFFFRYFISGSPLYIGEKVNLKIGFKARVCWLSNIIVTNKYDHRHHYCFEVKKITTMRFNIDDYIDHEEVCKIFKISEERFNNLLLINYIPAITNVHSTGDQLSLKASHYLRSDIEMLLAS